MSPLLLDHYDALATDAMMREPDAMHPAHRTCGHCRDGDCVLHHPPVDPETGEGVI